MKKLILSMVTLIALSCNSQSYVFCPELKGTGEDRFLNNPITVVIRDSRVYDKKLKEKCTKAEIFADIINALRQTYPNARISSLEEGKFNESPMPGVITIKLDIQKYDATFYTGMYISHTKYEVTVYDYRIEEKDISDVIEGEGKQWNSIGFTSGKIASKASFQNAFDKLILFLDQLPEIASDKIVPAKNQQTNKTGNKSKIDRLRELKQLLDEKILTQEEYEKEKKKILEEGEK